MKLTNQLIYQKAQGLAEFKKSDMRIPMKANFFLQKNIQALLDAAIEIDDAKMTLAKQYGVIADNGNIIISPEHYATVNQEINDLMQLEQDLPIHLLKLEDFNNIELSCSQMDAIMFMIEE